MSEDETDTEETGSVIQAPEPKPTRYAVKIVNRHGVQTIHSIYTTQTAQQLLETFNERINKSEPLYFGDNGLDAPLEDREHARWLVQTEPGMRVFVINAALDQKRQRRNAVEQQRARATNRGGGLLLPQ